MVRIQYSIGVYNLVVVRVRVTTVRIRVMIRVHG